MDQWGVGRKGFDDGLVILLRPRREPPPRPGPALRRPRLPDVVPVERGAPGDLRERHAAAPPRRRPRRGRCSPPWPRSTRAPRPRTPQDLERGRLINAVVGLLVGPGLFLVLVGWAVFHWLRFGRDPGLRRRPVGPHARPAGRPDARPAARSSTTGESSRRTLTTALLDLASRGELAFEQRRRAAPEEGRDPDRGRRAPANDEDAARRRLNARRAARRRPRRTPSASCATSRSAATSSRTTTCSSSARRSTSSTTKLEALRGRPRLVRARRPARSSTAGPAAGSSSSSSASVALFVGFQIPISGLVVLGVGLVVGRRSRPSSSPAGCRPGRWPARRSGRCWRPTAGPSRRRWPRPARWTRSSTRRSSPGSRRPTRRWSGPSRSASSTRPRRSSSGAGRTSRTAGRHRARSGSRPGTGRRARSPGPASAGWRRVGLLGVGRARLRRDVQRPRHASATRPRRRAAGGFGGGGSGGGGGGAGGGF